MHDVVLYQCTEHCESIAIWPQLARVVECHNCQEAQNANVFQHPPDQQAPNKFVANRRHRLHTLLRNYSFVFIFVDDGLYLLRSQKC